MEGSRRVLGRGNRIDFAGGLGVDRDGKRKEGERTRRDNWNWGDWKPRAVETSWNL